MLVSFEPDWIEPTEIDDAQLIGVFRPPVADQAEDGVSLITQALRVPIGSPRLLELAKGKERVVILSDDNTRSTRADLLLPPILAELSAAGVGEDKITVLMALGTHRAMTAAEIEAKLGAELARRLRVVNHDWKDSSILVDLGETEHGTPIHVNKLALEADLLIGLGLVLPHRVAGYSAGGKIVQPGISGEATTGSTHWLSAQFSMFDTLGKRDNPVRAEIDAVAEKVGLDFVVNTVQDVEGHLLGVYAGHLVEAHRVASQHAAKMSTVEIPELADVVVADAYPADIDIWQAVKGFFPAAQAVKKGGVIILLAACSEGVADQHPEVLEYGYRPLKEVRQIHASGKIADLSATAHLAHVSEVVIEHARCVLVSPGVSEEETHRLYLHSADTLSEALVVAQGLLGNPTPSVTVLQNAAEVIVWVTGS